MVKLSVIIPVYNAESFLSVCVDSILEQSFHDLEILLINDGSKDSSGEICDKYVEKDSRVKVFHQENKGVSAARNLGIEHAKGDYLLFIDSDDFIEQDSFIYIYNAIQSEKDLYMFNTARFSNGEIKSLDSNKCKSVELKNEVWNYIFKRDIIISNNLSFIDIKYGEDYNFVVKYFTFIDTSQSISEVVYVYRLDNNESAMKRSIDIKMINDHFVMIKDIVKSSNICTTKKSFLQFSLRRSFVMTMIIIIQSGLYKTNRDKVRRMYRSAYKDVSNDFSMIQYHPFFLDIWMLYYKTRLK